MRSLFVLSVLATVALSVPVAAQQSLSESDADELVQSYIDRKERCPNADESYGWICGQTVQMPGNHSSEVCTSKDEPFFVGSLSLPGQSANFLSQSLTLTYELPLDLLTPCKAWENPANPSNCAAISLYPSTAPLYGRFNERPPESLPEDLPSRPFVHVGHTSEPTAFSILNNEAVAFFYVQWIGKKPNSQPDACTLQTRLPERDIGLSLTLPCDDIDDWKRHLQTAVDAVDSRILRETDGATCDSLPEGAVLLIEEFQSSKIDGLKKWLQQRE